MPLPLRSWVRLKALTVLKANVPEVNNRVFSGRAWPLMAGAEKTNLPAILLYVFRERKVSNGSLGPPSFTTTVSLTTIIRCSGVSEEVVETEMEKLSGSVEVALLEDPEFVSNLSTIGDIETNIGIRQEGDILVGETATTMDVVMHEDFQPRIPDLFLGADVRIDAIDPADPIGEYTVPAPWPAVAPPPRPHGPDGRAEWEGPLSNSQT